MLNQVVLMGRLTRDPELRRTQNDTPVVSFRIAVDRDYHSQGEERKADFIDITAWRHTAEFIANYFTKGRVIVIEGRLEVQDYTDREGNKRQSTKVVAQNAYFGDSKRSEGQSDGSSNGRPYDQQGEYNGGYDPGTFNELQDDDGDLPF